jgi:hypothetical protein
MEQIMTTRTLDLNTTQNITETLLALLGPDIEVILTKGNTPVAKVTSIKQCRARNSAVRCVV